MKLKENIIVFFLSFIISFIFSYLLSKIKNGIFLPFGWSGMYLYLDKYGLPISWITKCPITITNDQFPVPTGCENGLNLIAFMFNILFFAIIIFLFIKLIKHKKTSHSPLSRQG